LYPSKVDVRSNPVAVVRSKVVIAQPAEAMAIPGIAPMSVIETSIDPPEA
jgi:hypothetical protein